MIIFICIFMCNTDAVIKNIMVSVADCCCTKARGGVGMNTKRKVSTASRNCYILQVTALASLNGNQNEEHD